MKLSLKRICLTFFINKRGEKMEKTLVMIKPNGTRRNIVGKVISRFESSRLKVVRLEMKTFTRDEAAEFYKEHKGKYYFDPLLDFIVSGPIVAIVLEGENAIANVRTIIGATDPEKASPGTLRYDLADSMRENLVHASDGPESAKREIEFHFNR